MNDRIMQWTITSNNKVLNDYDNLRIKKLKSEISESGTIKSLLDRSKSKMIYFCQSKYDDLIWYDVFINFVMPIPVKFLLVSLYEYQEIYPTEQEFTCPYRAWRFFNSKNAIKKFDSIK